MPTKWTILRGKHQISFRYFYSKFNQPAVIPAKDNLLAANSSGNEVRVQNTGVNHTYTVSPTVLARAAHSAGISRWGVQEQAHRSASRTLE